MSPRPFELLGACGASKLRRSSVPVLGAGAAFFGGATKAPVVEGGGARPTFDGAGAILGCYFWALACDSSSLDSSFLFLKFFGGSG